MRIKSLIKEIPKKFRYLLFVSIVICAALIICLAAASSQRKEAGSTYYVGALKSLEQDVLVLQFATGREQSFSLEEDCDIPAKPEIGDTVLVRASWQEGAAVHVASRVVVAEAVSQEKLEEAIRQVISENRDPVKENQFACFDYAGISTHSEGVTAAATVDGDNFYIDRVTAYGIVLEQVYAKRNGQLKMIGTNHTHVAITFRVTDSGEFVPLEYWLPNADSYEQDVREKFGSLPALGDYLPQQEAACLQQAQVYFAQQEPPKEPGCDIDFVSAEPNRYYAFIYDPDDPFLMYKLDSYDHYVDIESLTSGSLYVIDKSEKKYTVVVESDARILEITQNTIFCVVGDGTLIRCDSDGGRMHTVYETNDNQILGAERRWEYMCLTQMDKVVWLNLLTYEVESVYPCQGVRSAFPISDTEYVWRTVDYRYYVVDTSADQQREISKEEAEKLSAHIELNTPEPFIEPEEPTVPNDLVIPDGIEGVVTYWQPLEELTGYSTPRQAADDGCVVMVDGDAWANEKIWIKYTQAFSRGEAAKARVAQFDAEYKLLRLFEVVNAKGSYVYRIWNAGVVTEKCYLYLQVDVNSSYDGEDFNMYKMYTLTNDTMWQYRDQVPIDGGIWEDGSVTVFCNLYYRHDYAPIPDDLQCAEIRNQNGTVATIWDREKLQTLAQILGSAEGDAGWPKTVETGPTLVLTGIDGTKVEAMMMANGTMIEIDGVFYNYDPGWQEVYGIKDILSLFGLVEIP